MANMRLGTQIADDRWPGFEATTLADSLRIGAEYDPQQPTLTFLGDGDTADLITYGELDQRARQIAGRLQAVGPVGETALILHPPGLEYVSAFFGCQYAGIVAVPVYPPELRQPDPTLRRLLGIVAEVRTGVVLTTSEILAMKDTLVHHGPELEGLTWIATDAIDPSAENDWKAPALTSKAPALIQFTSGSTAAPRGVVLSHGNVMHNIRLLSDASQCTYMDTGVCWLPTSHNMGLIGNVIGPIVAGTEWILMSPITFLREPLRWLEAISHYGATVSGAPNFAYDLCVSKTTAEQRADLDLSSWRCAFIGAEPIRAETLERFVDAFGPYGFSRESFYPCYGLAEATSVVSGGCPSEPPTGVRVRRADLQRGRAELCGPEEPNAHTLIGCGQTQGEQTILIVDPESLRPLPPRTVGEIWLSGSSVASSYWRQSDLTAEVFGAQPAGGEGGRFLRTGDLGFLHEGELFVTGRMKDLITIRGRNLAPEDIEAAVDICHPRLRPGCGAAFSVDVDGEEGLVFVQEVDASEGIDTDAVVKCVRDVIARDFGLSAHSIALIEPRSIPKTSSGRIQRQATRAAFLERSLEAIAKGEPTPSTESNPRAGA